MAQSKTNQEITKPPTNRGGFLTGANTVDTQDMVLAPVKRVDTELDRLLQEEISNFINALKIIKVDKTKGELKNTM